MKFFVTTSSTLSIYDGKLSDIKVVPQGRRIYGLSWNKDKAYVAIKYPDNEQDTIEEFDRGFNFKKVPIDRYLHGVHQLLCLENLLYIVNTDQNEILILDLNSGNINVKKWRGTEPPVHLNSIWQHDEEFYVVEHRMDKSIVWMGNKNWGRIREFSGLSHVHNVYVENDKLYCLSSIETSIVMIDLKSGKIEEKIKLKPLFNGVEYIRGLARGQNHWIVGFNKRAKRYKRWYKCNGSVAILDNDFREVDHVAIPSRGQIHEVRLIDEKDYAHNEIVW